ncbi:ADP-ribosylglycohydrolase family protein [Mycolicibacterium sphagni]|uniref:ADP-ribosylglycohydrolase family protein n=1 Tax=Mycolicibacterium sphagni TaxID=1786 RepID=A0ABX2JWF4_9MYCO|nr:ADP-ribosylglycohydrolase family protein [Mycolicibacterium sphagni]NTY62063.1 ADP-ribosylglycohydrolase family protein [Mycolicibacterium sphagni]
MSTQINDSTTTSTHFAAKWADVLRGCAYGDAWGNTNEFKSYKSLTRTTAYGPNLPQRLVITDDTQMTLALARAIDTAGTADDEALRTAIVDEFVGWRSDPDNNRAPGNTCLRATAALAAGSPWTAATVVGSDGCGTVMRTSPAAFLPNHLWRPVAAWQAAVTHGKASGIAAALVMTAVIREAARGCMRPGKALGYAVELSTHPALRHGIGKWIAGHPQASTAAEADAFLAEGLREVADVLRHAHSAVEAFQRNPWGDDPCRYAGQGWRAQETLAVALLCVDALPSDPVSALRRATVTEGDSDSIAAVAGAILGALHRDPWPAEWADRLEPRYRDWISTAENYQF